MEEVTFGNLKKPSVRKEIQEESVVSLGTQAGNYGMFTEEARILTLRGAKEIAKELRDLCEQEALDFDVIIECTPTLKGLIE